MSRLTRTTRVAGALVLAVCGVGAGLTARAAVIPGAVTDVRIEETKANTWSQVKLFLDWKVPDGTRGGDTFALLLPEELKATDGTTFLLKDADGKVVASAVVAGRTVTFTMTEYAETHVGVHGSAWFWVNFASIVKPGDDLDLVFKVDSRTYRDSIVIGNPGPGNPDYPSKWQAWMTAAENQRSNRILWGITGPTVRENLVGQTYQIVDTAGEGQEIDCSHVDVFSGTLSAGDWTYVSRDRWNLECSPRQVSVTVKPRSGEVGRAFRLLGQSAITDDTRTEYRNSGFVRLWGQTTLPVENTIRAGGAGEGTGTTPSPTTTTTTPNPTTTSPGTSTGSPTPTVTVTTTPTATTTVTAPGPTVIITPGPTVTVTSPGTTAPPNPTQTSPGTTAPNPTQTSPGTTAPGTPTVTPTPTVTVTLPGSTPTSSATTTTRTVAASTPTPVSSASPRVVQSSPHRIDTGVPASGMDPRLAGAGGAMVVASGVGLLALSRRRPSRDEA